MPGTVQRVRMRPSELWTFAFEQQRLGENGVLDSFRKRIKLDFEILM